MARTRRVLTVEILREKNACKGQLNIFIKNFGDKMVVTKSICVKHANIFDWEWAAINLLKAPARAEYDKVRDAAWAEYDKVCAAAWAELYIKE